MVINTNMTGTGGTPPSKTVDRPGSKSATSGPSNTSSGVAGVNNLDSQVSRIFADSASDIDGSASARASAQIARTNILHQPATAMLAQANLSPDSVLNLLGE
jgi:hypothetical protein